MQRFSSILQESETDSENLGLRMEHVGDSVFGSEVVRKKIVFPIHGLRVLGFRV